MFPVLTSQGFNHVHALGHEAELTQTPPVHSDPVFHLPPSFLRSPGYRRQRGCRRRRRRRRQLTCSIVLWDCLSGASGSDVVEDESVGLVGRHHREVNLVSTVCHG